MSLSKSNNYSVVDVDKSCIKSNISQDEPPLSNTRRYEVKKVSALKKEHTNQNNTLYGNDRQFRHRTHAPTDAGPKCRYKSYDYLPARRPSMDRYRNNPCTHRDAFNDYSDSGGDIAEDSHEDIHKFRKSYSYGGGKAYSSNEELDNSCNYNFDPNPSSDSSRRYQYRPEKVVDNHSDYHRSSRHNDFENRKYGPTNSWNYDSMNNLPDTRRYSRYSPTRNKLCKSPGVSKPKYGLRGTSYPSYLNNNRSDLSPRKLHTTQLASDLRCPRYNDINNDNYASHRKEVPNSNMLSLKSTYRKDENIPHSGTRLETHRKQLDKYCTGRSRGARFDESNNCDESRRNNPMTTNRSSKSFRTNLPPSPKYSTTRKKYDVKSSVNNKYFNKEKFTTPRRPQMFSRDQISDNESCYFENCHNTNNENTSQNRKGIIERNKDNCASVSDEPSSSSFVQSQEKPTESMPLSISTPKLNSSIKPLHSTLNRSKCLWDHINMSSSQTNKCFQTKQPSVRCVHSERSSRHRNVNKHH